MEMKKTIRQFMVGGFYGLSIAAVYYGFIQDSMRLLLLGIWLVGSAILGTLVGIEKSTDKD